MERLNDVTYRIKRGERTKPKVVHVSRLWKYHGRGQYTWNEVHQEPDIGESGSDDEARGTRTTMRGEKTSKRREMTGEDLQGLATTRGTRKLTSWGRNTWRMCSWPEIKGKGDCPGDMKIFIYMIILLFVYT